VRTLEYLTLDGFWQAILAGVAIVLMCSLVSVLVVVKRLAFVGQGVSHSAFGGVGVAAVLAAAWPAAGHPAIEFAVIVAFCMLAAVAMAAASDRRTVQFDTAIGVALVGSMALGAVLVEASRRVAAAVGSVGFTPRSWESILFGSLFPSGTWDLALAWAMAAVVAGSAWLIRRPMLFWTFDEPTATAFGVPSQRIKFGMMLLLTVAVVTSMKLAGVVLASALLVLPGATALRLSDRLGAVVALSCAIGLAGLAAGVVLSFETDMPPGASVVLVLAALFAAAWGATARAGRAPARA
jgi:zinc transport system permease protein